MRSKTDLTAGIAIGTNATCEPVQERGRGADGGMMYIVHA